APRGRPLHGRRRALGLDLPVGPRGRHHGLDGGRARRRPPARVPRHEPRRRWRDARRGRRRGPPAASGTGALMGEELLDPLIHTQARLRIMTTLTSLPRGDRLTFPRLQALVEASAGNLSTHLRRLEEAGYVEVVKG